MDRVLVRQARTIGRRIARARGEYYGHEAEFETNRSRQDVTVRNLIRGCEAVIDTAKRIIRKWRLELADDAREAFDILDRHKVRDKDLAASMQCMVGFRNVAVHEYQELDIARVRKIIEARRDELVEFSAAMLRADAG